MLTVTFSMLARSGNFSANARRFMEYEAGAPGGVGGLVQEGMDCIAIVGLHCMSSFYAEFMISLLLSWLTMFVI